MAVKKYVGEEAIERVSQYVNRKLTVVAAMPASPEEADVRLYIGPTTEDFIQGGIYLYLDGEWHLISQADVDLSDYETSWTGTQDDYWAMTEDERAQYEIVNFTDDFSPSGDHVISGYYYNGQFYEDVEHTTLIVPEVGFIYIDLPYDDLYLYDDTEAEYVLAGGGGADSIVYVETLPSTNIENVIYGVMTSTAYNMPISDGFLDSNDFFKRTDGTGDDYVYTAADGITLQASEDDTEYKDFTSLEYDGTSDWTLTFGDGTSVTLADGDTFYFKQLQMMFYAGNEDDQILIPLAGNGDSGETYTAGDGINIDENNEISVVNRLEETTALPTITTELVEAKKTYLLTEEQTGYTKGGIYQAGTEIVLEQRLASTQNTLNSLDFLTRTQDGVSQIWTPKSGYILYSTIESAISDKNYKRVVSILMYNVAQDLVTVTFDDGTTNQRLAIQSYWWKAVSIDWQSINKTNVQADWNQSTSTADDYIKNKPTLGTAAAKNYTTSVTSGSADVITSGGVYTYVDTVITQALTGSY